MAILGATTSVEYRSTGNSSSQCCNLFFAPWRVVDNPCSKVWLTVFMFFMTGGLNLIPMLFIAIRSCSRNRSRTYTHTHDHHSTSVGMFQNQNRAQRSIVHQVARGSFSHHQGEHREVIEITRPPAVLPHHQPGWTGVLPDVHRSHLQIDGGVLPNAHQGRPSGGMAHGGQARAHGGMRSAHATVRRPVVVQNPTVLTGRPSGRMAHGGGARAQSTVSQPVVVRNPTVLTGRSTGGMAHVGVARSHGGMRSGHDAVRRPVVINR